MASNKSKSKVNDKQQKKLQDLGNAQNQFSIDCFESVTDKMKFNFSFFDQTQYFKKAYSNLSVRELLKIGDKIIEFSSRSLKEWENMPMLTKNSKLYEIYGDFPSNSHFVYPKHVPDFVAWGRFRLGSKVRLCGFVIPAQYRGECIKGCSEVLCTNTFYVVFYDHDHKFCPT